jgi:hypothetical protein
MAIRLFNARAFEAGDMAQSTNNSEMFGLRVVFRYTIRNTGNVTFHARGDLRGPNGEVFVTETGSVEPGESTSGEVSYDTVPANAYVELMCLGGKGTITVDCVDLDPSSAAQAGTGWADYEHSGSVQAVTKNTWTTLVNDGAGTTLTTDKTFLPIGVADLFDVSNNKLEMSSITYGTQVNFRFDVTINPDKNNREGHVRLLFNDPTLPATWSFEGKPIPMRAGAGVDYKLVELFTFFVADFWSTNLIITPQVYCTSDANVTVGGWYIRMH